VHEPDAAELQPDQGNEYLTLQGLHVGRVAAGLFPAGRLIESPHANAQIAATWQALEEGASVVFEASFEANGVFVAVDVLERDGDAFHVIEVKSTTSTGPEHIHDLAVQIHVIRENGLKVNRAEIMHLNKDYRHPNLGELFERRDLTEEVEQYMTLVEDEIGRQLAMLSGSLPNKAIGLQCYSPQECPFKSRCWPDVPNHISTLYNTGAKKTCSYMQQGVNTIADLPKDAKLPSAAQRQLKAVAENRLIVEDSLAKALKPFSGRVGHLDFETVAPAIPVWLGIRPWGPAAVQFSYHEERDDGTTGHVDYLASGPDDPRPELARRLIEATAGADSIVTYSSYEKRMIRDLKEAVPDLETSLAELEDKLVDLLPVVRNNVYHPGFKGSFSLKAILNPLVPALTYDDLVIADGQTATVEIARLLFEEIAQEEQDEIRRRLLQYCERDTWATVRLLGRLRELAAI